MRAVFMLLILAYISSVIVAQDPQPKGGNHVICYYTYWSYGRKPPYNFKPEDVDPFLCTHVIYAFAIFGQNYDFDKTKGDFMDLQPRLIALKQRNPKLKIMFAAGGWKEGSTGFVEITKTQETRMKFVRNVVSFLRENNFDGIDLNWQHPTFREGGGPEDRENYVFLAQALRDAFNNEAMASGKPRLLLAVSILQAMKPLTQAYDIQSFNTYMDFISILCYDYFLLNAHLTSVKHHSPLHAILDSPDYEEEKTFNIDYTVNYFLDRADPEKLVLGIPTYGRTRKLVDPADTELGAEADGVGTKGPYTDEDGFLAYFEICLKINNENWTVGHTKPYGSVGPHAFKDNQWVGYDDVEMVRTKARYAKQRGLAGVVFWTIDYDDFLGSCGKRRFPLINAAKDELNMKNYRNETYTIFPEEPIRSTVQPITKRPKPTTLRPRPPQTDTPTRPPPTTPPTYTLSNDPPPRTRRPVVMTPPPSPVEAGSATTSSLDQRGGDSQHDDEEGNDLQDDLVQDLVQLIERAGGMKSFCRILRDAKSAYKKTQASSRRFDDMVVDIPNLEPLRLLISNSSITIQQLNVYGGP